MSPHDAVAPRRRLRLRPLSRAVTRPVSVLVLIAWVATMAVLVNRSYLQASVNLATDLSPTHIKRWLSTGCQGLNYIIANRRDGGLPEGRIIEIFGPPSIGKSHVAIQLARETQAKGGIVIYMDTENATQVGTSALPFLKT